MSIYDRNKVLFLPLTTKKADDNKVPALIPVNCDIFDFVLLISKKIMKIGILNVKLKNQRKKKLNLKKIYAMIQTLSMTEI
jgi:hypothetical protein